MPHKLKSHCVLLLQCALRPQSLLAASWLCKPQSSFWVIPSGHILHTPVSSEFSLCSLSGLPPGSLSHPFLVTPFNDPLSSQTQYFTPPSIPREDFLSYYYSLFVDFEYYLSMFFPYERRRIYKFCPKVSIWKKASSKCGVCGINGCTSSNYTHVSLHSRWNMAVFLEWQGQQGWLAVFQAPPWLSQL